MNAVAPLVIPKLEPAYMRSISPWEVTLYWERISELLEPIMALKIFDNSLEDIHKFMLNGHFKAWHCDWRMIVICEFMQYGADAQYPTKTVCNINLVSGEGIDEFISDLLFLEHWAKTLGADECRVIGRKAWLKKLDYEETAVILRKRL